MDYDYDLKHSFDNPKKIEKVVLDKMTKNELKRAYKKADKAWKKADKKSTKLRKKIEELKIMVDVAKSKRIELEINQRQLASDMYFYEKELWSRGIDVR